LKPEKTLKKTTAYLENLKRAKKINVVVGLTKEKASSLVYPSGRSVVEVGTFHELGTENIPQRSFLRVPFALKKNDIQKILVKLFNGVAESGKDVVIQMEKAGVFLQNISKSAFTNKGFGTWPDIKEQTKKQKGSSGILIDKGLLRNSITYEVRE